MTRSEKMARKNPVCERCMEQIRKHVRQYVTEELISKFLSDLDFLEGNGNADWNIKTKIRPKWEAKLKE